MKPTTTYIKEMKPAVLKSKHNAGLPTLRFKFESVGRTIKFIITLILGITCVYYCGYITEQQTNQWISTSSGADISQKIALGVARYNLTEQSQPAPSFVEYEANVSAYCLCEKCCGKWANVYPRRTASGHIIKPGDKFVAASKAIPFGTMIDIPGYGFVPVLDRGGAITGDKLDVYMESHEEALQWGRKHIKVRMYIKQGLGVRG